MATTTSPFYLPSIRSTLSPSFKAQHSTLLTWKQILLVLAARGVEHDWERGPLKGKTLCVDDGYGQHTEIDRFPARSPSTNEALFQLVDFRRS